MGFDADMDLLANTLQSTIKAPCEVKSTTVYIDQNYKCRSGSNNKKIIVWYPINNDGGKYPTTYPEVLVQCASDGWDGSKNGYNL